MNRKKGTKLKAQEEMLSLSTKKLKPRSKRSQKKSKIVCHRVMCAGGIYNPSLLRALPRASVHGYNGDGDSTPRVDLQKRVKRPGWTLTKANRPLKIGDFVEAQTCCKKPLPTKVLEIFGDKVVLADPPRCLPKLKGKGRKLGSDSDSEGEKSACQQKKHDLDAFERMQKAEREEFLRGQNTVPKDDVHPRNYLLPSEITEKNYLKVLSDQLLPLLDAPKEGDFVENLEEAGYRDAGLYIIKKKRGKLSIATLEGECGSGTTVIGQGLSLGPQFPVGYWNRAEFSAAYFSEGYGLPVGVGNACKEPLDVSVWGLITEEDLTEIEGGECDRGDDQGDECAREYSWGTLCFPAKKNVVISQLSRLKQQGIKLLYFQVKNSGWVPSSADAWTCLDGQGNCVAELDLFTLGQWIDDEAYFAFGGSP